MRTLTEEQFKKLYGEQAITAFTTPTKKTFGQDLVGDISQTGGAIRDIFSETGQRIGEARQAELEGRQSGLRGMAQSVGLTAGATARGVGELFKGGVKAVLPEETEEAIRGGISSVAEPVGRVALSLPPVRKFLEDYQNLSEEQKRDVDALFGVGSGAFELATAGFGGRVAGAGKKIAQEGVEAGIKQTTGVIDDLTSGAKALVTQTPEEIASQKLAGALQDVTPRFEMLSPAQKGKVLGRTKEGGILTGRKVTPTKAEQASAKALSSLDEYDPNATALSKYQLVDKKIAEEAENLKSSLLDEKIIIPKKEISSNVAKSIKETVKDSLTFQKTDPVVQKYTKVLTTALSKSDGTISGILDVRKAMDKAYKNSRGKLAFGSDKITSLDEIHSASRDALNQLLFKYSKNTDVQKSLKFQSDLFRALDNLRFVAEREAGTSLGRLLQKYPIATKIGKEVGKAVGIGKAVEVFTP